MWSYCGCGLLQEAWVTLVVARVGVEFEQAGSDMKSDVVMVAIVLIGDFIFMLLGLDLVLYILGYLCILYVTLFNLIVLYSRCRVNQDTNMSVVCVLCNILSFASTARLGVRVAFPTCGVHPHYAAVRSITSGFEDLC